MKSFGAYLLTIGASDWLSCGFWLTEITGWPRIKCKTLPNYDLYLLICWRLGNCCCLRQNDFCLPPDVATANDLSRIWGS